MGKKKYQYKPNFFQRNYSFEGCIERGVFWSEVGTKLISCLCACIAICIVLSVALKSETELVIRLTNTGLPIFAVLWMTPIIPLSRRRLRDAGYDAKSYLWLLLPVIGWIVFLVRLCKK